VANANSRPTASEALQHGWLNGTAGKHQQLQAAPHRLMQLVNGRKLKVCILADSALFSVMESSVFHTSTLGVIMIKLNSQLVESC